MHWLLGERQSDNTACGGVTAGRCIYIHIVHNPGTQGPIKLCDVLLMWMNPLFSPSMCLFSFYLSSLSLNMSPLSQNLHFQRHSARLRLLVQRCGYWFNVYEPLCVRTATCVSEYSKEARGSSHWFVLVVFVVVSGCDCFCWPLSLPVCLCLSFGHSVVMSVFYFSRLSVWSSTAERQSEDRRS